MLVLTRKQQEQIQIGDNIKITLIRVKGRTVRLGIEAPSGVRVLRTELLATEAETETVEVGTSGAKAPSAPTRRRTNTRSEARPVCLTSLRPYLELSEAAR